jgi:hypothetical protein
MHQPHMDHMMIGLCYYQPYQLHREHRQWHPNPTSIYHSHMQCMMWYPMMLGMYRVCTVGIGVFHWMPYMYQRGNPGIEWYPVMDPVYPYYIERIWMHQVVMNKCQMHNPSILSVLSHW